MGSGPTMPLDQALQWGFQLLVVWLLGLSLGYLLPRPRWLQKSLAWKDPLLQTPTGSWFRQIALVLHAALVFREVIVRLCPPGTFRTLLVSSWRALARRLAVALRRLSMIRVESEDEDEGGILLAGGGENATEYAQQAPADPFIPHDREWWVDTRDLEQFRASCERLPAAGEPEWEPVLRKEWDGCVYSAERRLRPGVLSGTEYRSTTIVKGASAEAVMDFYLDDDVRAVWDPMIKEHSLVSSRPGLERCQVVRWLRTFPLAVVSSREYLLARRVFRERIADDESDPESIYAIVRAIDHPAVPHQEGTVRMEDCYSMWRSRDVEWPGEPGCMAAETVLLHFEDLGIPDNLARFAVRHGMLGFMKRMLPEQRAFLDRRALRGVDSKEIDLTSYGFRQVHCEVLSDVSTGPTASLPPKRRHRGEDPTHESSANSLPLSQQLSLAQLDSSADTNSLETESTVSGRSTRSLPSARRLTTMVLASSIAILLARSGARSSGRTVANLRRRRRPREPGSDGDREAMAASDTEAVVALSPSSSALSLAGLDTPSAKGIGRFRLARLSQHHRRAPLVPISDDDE